MVNLSVIHLRTFFVLQISPITVKILNYYQMGKGYFKYHIFDYFFFPTSKNITIYICKDEGGRIILYI